MASSQVPALKVAMEKEIVAFRALDVMEMCWKPLGANLVSCKWIFVSKYNTNSTLNKLKARLVARGFSQIHSLDINKTFAPIASMITFRIFISMPNQSGFLCHVFYMKIAFLHAVFTEE